eukprot:m.82090 g.82090  ORF g.82090 m.82090 type:complete len:606 (+) comp36281_c0_seq2:29-1846(+)
MADAPAGVSKIQLVLDSIKGRLPSQLYRLLLKSTQTVVKNVFAALEGSESSSVAVNKREYILLASSMDTDEAYNLFRFVGYQEVAGMENSMVLMDPFEHVASLIQLNDLIQHTLESSRSSSVEQLRSLDNVGLLVAHLSYNYHLRLELYILVFSPEMFPVIEEDVHASIECIEYLFARLNMASQGDHLRQLWLQVRQLSEKRLSSSTPNAHIQELNEKIVETSRLIATELAQRVSFQVVNIFLFLHVLRLGVAVFSEGGLLVVENMEAYISSFYGMPPSSFTPRFTASVEEVSGLFFETKASSLPADRKHKLTAELIWQSFHFMDHYRSDGIQPGDASGQLPFVGSMSVAAQMNLGGMERSDPEWSTLYAGQEAEMVTGLHAERVSDVVDNEESETEKEDVPEKEDLMEKTEKMDALKASLSLSSHEDDLNAGNSSAVSCTLDELRALLQTASSPTVIAQILCDLEQLKEMRVGRASEVREEIDQLSSVIDEECAPQIVVDALMGSVEEKKRELHHLEWLVTELDALEIEGQRKFKDCHVCLRNLSVADISDLLGCTLTYQGERQSRNNLTCMLQRVVSLLPADKVSEICQKYKIEQEQLKMEPL